MRLIQLDAVCSTNTWLRQNRAELSHGDAVTALRQTAGRGRLGNVWLADDGMLPVSVLLRMEQVPQCVTLSVAVAVCEVLKPIVGEMPQIKWPNDIILHGHKLCGILCESAANGDKTDIICGVGLNLSQSADWFNAAGIPHGGSLLSLVGVTADRESLAYGIAESILRHCEMPFSELYQSYKAHCVTLGREVRIIRGGEERTAFALDIAQDGCLICRDDSGEFSVNSGEVSVRGILGYI